MAIFSDAVILEEALPFKYMFIEKAYLNYDYATVQNCYKGYHLCAFYIYFRLANSFPHYYNHFPFVISRAFEVKDEVFLFFISQKLVTEDPKSELTLFAIGCYYLLKRRFEESKRSFLRGINSKTKDFVYNWIGIGHVHSIFGDHDQAISCYKTAAGMLST